LLAAGKVRGLLVAMRTGLHNRSGIRTREPHMLRLSLPLITALLLSGCTSLPNGQRWGENATVSPGWERVRTSAVNAARDPWVWGPLLGAAALQIDDWDRRTSDWAREETPIFGSQNNASDWSDDLRSASTVAQRLTLLATPGGDDASDWLVAKGKGALVQFAAISATSSVTNQLKTRTSRERPNGAGDRSFPSGHASKSAVHTRLAVENLQSIEMGTGTRRALGIGFNALTIGTSWARVEAGVHFPADTLVGMALGNFIGSFVNDAFLGLDQSNVSVGLAPTREGAVLQWNWAF
jgi:membrane-associated phospholipid phosphatase